MLYASASKSEDVRIALTLLGQPDLERLGASSIIDIIHKYRKLLDYTEINRILSANSKTTIHKLAMGSASGALRLLGSRFANYFSAHEIVQLHNEHCRDETYFNALQDGGLESGKAIPSLIEILAKARKERSIKNVANCVSGNKTLFGLFYFEYKIKKTDGTSKMAAAAGGAGTKVSYPCP